VGLVAKLFYYRLDLSIPLAHHFFPNFALSLNVLVLSLLKKLAFELILFNHELFFDLLDLVLVAPLHIFDAVLARLSFLADLVRTSRLHLLHFFFKTVVFHFKHLLDTSIFTEHRVLPSFSLFCELRLKTLILLMKLVLCSLSLLVDSLFFLIDELGAQFMHALLVLLHDMLALLASLARMGVLQATNFIFVSLDDALDLRLETLDGLSTNLMDLLLLPFFFAHFLGRHPSLLIFLKLHL